MTKLKSQRHHWWPECVSEFWKDSTGLTHWILADGTERHLPPKNLGVIGNGHHIKFARRPDETTPWDESFEPKFDRADSNFPAVINWLDGLARQSGCAATPGASRFLEQEAPEQMLSLLVEGMVSLSVRSPRNRQAAVAVAEKLRGPLPERERNLLIGSNMRDMQQRVVNAIGTTGKFAIIYSPEREFIFGDGFFFDIGSPAGLPMVLKILVPLTPHIAALFAKPMQYSTDPRLVTLMITPEEADSLNHAVQVYAKDALFYREHAPTITTDFRLGEHRRYEAFDNPIDGLIYHIPGVPPRDRTFDQLLARTQGG